jgi:hypothetical protein
MPKIIITDSPGSGVGVFDNIVGLQVTEGGGLTLGTFEFRSSITDDAPITLYVNSFSNPITLESLSIDNNSSFRELVSKELNVYPNYDLTQVMGFTLYGSLAKRFSVSITKIINYYPASIDINLYDINFSTGYTATNILYDQVLNETEFDINIEKIYNPFGIDFSKNAETNIKSREIAISEYRNLSKFYLDYDLQLNGVNYPLLNLDKSNNLNTGVLKIIVEGNPFSGGSQSVDSYIIKPNDYLYNLVLKTDFDEIEQYMLNTISIPKYTMTLQVPEENINGEFLVYNRDITFPLDGIWNIDISSSSFTNYINELQEIAEYFDSVRTNLISRFLVSDSLKEFDTFDRRVESVLQIYGRSFDEVKKFIDSLAFMNSVNYTPKNDIPSQLLSNLANTLGWAENFQFITDQTLVESLFGNNSDFKFPAYNRSQTPLELNYSFYRNLVINSFYLFKSKGTRKSIEFILKLFGIPDALIEFNEHIYLADQKINLDKFNSELVKINTGSYIDNDPIVLSTTYPLSGRTYSAFTANTRIVNTTKVNYPLDVTTGYPQIKETDDFFFQMGAGWYQLTPEHRSLQVNTRRQVGTEITYGVEFEKLTYGEKYLDRLRKFPYIDEGFSLEKVIDNKKSWNSSNLLLRNSSDGDYNAYYTLPDERLLLNVKNVSLFLNPAQGLLYDIWVQSREKDYPIPQSGLTYPYPTTGGTDSTIINPQPKSKSFFEFAQTFANDMINVRNRLYITDGKTGGYPVLQSIFWKYIEAKITNNIDTNQYTYDKLIEYVNGINPNWINLVEQMIPATTLWMGGVKYENSPFHRQKYAYKRFSITGGTSPQVITTGNGVVVFGLTSIADGDEYITSPIFKDICDKNNINLLVYPSKSFNDILGDSISEAKLDFSDTCSSDNVLTTWYVEIILNNTIVSKVEFYNGLGSDDVPTSSAWNSAVLTGLEGVTKYDINYSLPNNNNVTFVDFACNNENTYDSTLVINVGIDITLICE